MTSPRTLLGAALAAAALATPAVAEPTAPGQDLVYTVRARDKSGSLDATCVFRPDRWTADYGPTYVDGVVYGGGVQHVEITCRIYTAGTLSGAVSAGGPGVVATITDERVGTVGYRPNVTVCVSASTAYIVDYGITVENCVTP